jgi:hypothetical protein
MRDAESKRVLAGAGPKVAAAVLSIGALVAQFDHAFTPGAVVEHAAVGGVDAGQQQGIVEDSSAKGAMTPPGKIGE